MLLIMTIQRIQRPIFHDRYTMPEMGLYPVWMDSGLMYGGVGHVIHTDRIKNTVFVILNTQDSINDPVRFSHYPINSERNTVSVFDSKAHLLVGKIHLSGNLLLIFDPATGKKWQSELLVSDFASYVWNQQSVMSISDDPLMWLAKWSVVDKESTSVHKIIMDAIDYVQHERAQSDVQKEE